MKFIKIYRCNYIHCTCFYVALALVKKNYENIKLTFNDCAVLQFFDVSSMYDFRKMASFRTWSITWDTFPFNSLFVWGTNPNTGPIILQEMFWTIPNTGGAISVFSIWVFLPFVFDRIVSLHWGTFLFTYSIVIEIATGL